MRKRFQQGGLLKRNGSWVGQWWENGHRRKRKLGPISQMTKAQAQIALAAIVEPINARTAGPSPNCKLRDFVKGHFSLSTGGNGSAPPPQQLRIGLNGTFLPNSGASH